MNLLLQFSQSAILVIWLTEVIYWLLIWEDILDILWIWNKRDTNHILIIRHNKLLLLCKKHNNIANNIVTVCRKLIKISKIFVLCFLIIYRKLKITSYCTPQFVLHNISPTPTFLFIQMNFCLRYPFFLFPWTNIK